jgi:hypothetical protein
MTWVYMFYYDPSIFHVRTIFLVYAYVIVEKLEMIW